MSSVLKSIRDVLVSSERILILSHVRPDGDAIGSQVGLALALLALHKEIAAWNQDGCPANLRFLAGSERVVTPPAAPESFDTVVCLDTASRERLGTSLAGVASARCWINVDHHGSNPGYGDINLVEAQAAATGEVVYELLTGYGLPFPLESAAALYVAISTDTGSFRYPNTTPRTLQTAADLLKRGIDGAAICGQIYESYPRRRAVLLGELLARARFEADDRVAAFLLDGQTKGRLGIHPEDLDGLIDAIRCIDSVVVAAFFEELPNGRVRVSLRSKSPEVNVDQLCREYGGGGHRAAAGARIRGGLQQVADIVLERVAREISQRH
ncbi:MAG TPA: bifunctional oligoribonuclease/PAP phosphatase NrnA [Chthoniobacterales bacterium]